MTIRTIWCPTCDCESTHHPTLCSVCGTQLVERPTPQRNNTTTTSAGRPEPRVRLVLENALRNILLAENNLGASLGALQNQVRELQQNVEVSQRLVEEYNTQLSEMLVLEQQRLRQAAGLQQNDGGAILERLMIPPEAFDPQQQLAARRATSKEALKKLTRIVISDRTSFLQEANVEIYFDDPGSDDGNRSRLRFSATVGEFGPSPPHSFCKTSLVMAGPKRSGKGGLDEQTQLACRRRTDGCSVILYMERGDGVTFVEKAMMAQKAGAVALIIGNNVSEPWPYTMKDTANKATKLGLAIPVVMIQQSDGQKIVERLRQHQQQAMTTNPPSEKILCDLNIARKDKDCVICTETFQKGQTVVQLPDCCHIFHESPCAMTWLAQSNTCPYCRRELPTDDASYEQERRRMQRTHAGPSRSSNDEATLADGGNTFYG